MNTQKNIEMLLQVYSDRRKERKEKKLTWCARSASALRDSASRSCKLNESNMASDIQRASLDMSANSNKIHR